ncbi:MAG TPA: LuxR C-terminal-related transcriptional regulator [Candidatus Limnocylindrales bacterium]|nr:LuxR C-terminal-related transcriptional regulator [Candidatus Limnocylindrales bacterium]
MQVSSVPARRSSLIGRDQDVAAITELALHGDSRLVTLSGVGGVGKTTLAFEVGRSVGPAATDGVWPVDLATVATGAHEDGIALACLRALGLVEQERSPLSLIVEYLEPRQGLLILDNCEHVQVAVGHVVDRLLNECPYLRVVATSRAPLRVRGEQVFRVEPLATPGGAGSGSLATLAAVPAVELFLRRARAADRGFALTDANASPVASICRRLAGLPLAIELAAAQVGALSPAEIEARLGPESDLLRSATVATPSRQQTLEDALEWSHQLLRPDEQALFRRLSVFAGGWTVEAAEAVCAVDGDPHRVAASLASLVEQSLVVRDQETSPARFHFLQPIAEFARRKLDASGETGALAVPHAQYYVGLANLHLAVRPHGEPEDLDRIAADHENCLAALRFAETAGIVPLALGMIVGLAEYWRVRAYMREAIPHLETLLAMVGEAPTRPRAFALAVLSDHERILGRLGPAVEHARTAVEVGDVVGDNYARRTPRGLVAEALAAGGDYVGGRAWYEEAKRILDEEPNPIALGFYHAGVGLISLREGGDALDDAYEHLAAAVALLRASPRTWYLGRALASLGAVERRRAELEAARTHLAAGFAELRAYGAQLDSIDCLEELGGVALDAGELGRGTTFLAVARALRDATAVEPREIDRDRLMEDIERARDGQSPRVFADAWERGRTMSFSEIAVFATSDDPAPPRRRRRASTDQLTIREREVADLVAEGLTNRQIGTALFVSPGTVRMHVERILGKLGLTSRVQIATWMVTVGVATEARPTNDAEAPARPRNTVT